MKNIEKWALLISAIFSALVVLYGVFKFVDSGMENTQSNKQLNEDIKILNNNFSTMKVQINVRLDSLKFVIDRREGAIRRIDERTGKLVNQFTRHLANDSTLTKQDLRDIINELDEKRNNDD